MPASDFLTWQSESAPSLEENQVHVWRIALDAVVTADAEKDLSADERERAARYRLERDRARFIAGRGVLRILLGRYLQQKPAQICFSYYAQGKPFVRDGFEFNVSHANDLMLLAVARELPVGIDLETGRANLNFMEIAARFFSQAEYRVLENLGEEERLETFLVLWTRKEALGKAIGTGIAEIFSKEPVAGQWSIYTLAPAPEYCGALAVRGSGHDIRFLNYFGSHALISDF